uniref:Uncharacterized protein n=1 Tax=Aegilops tauschii subsp. strangulata TaxID=200361 RepID=A0A453P5D2_AEGTS
MIYSLGLPGSSASFLSCSSESNKDRFVPARERDLCLLRPHPCTTICWLPWH